MDDKTFDGNIFGIAFGVVIMLIYVIGIYIITTCDKVG